MKAPRVQRRHMFPEKLHKIIQRSSSELIASDCWSLTR